jgi:transcription elongation factor Elf1
MVIQRKETRIIGSKCPRCSKEEIVPITIHRLGESFQRQCSYCKKPYHIKLSLKIETLYYPFDDIYAG